LSPNDKTTLASSPETGMPTRDSTFTASGEYTKKGWKSWGNTVQDGTSEAELGRRISE